MIKISSFIVRRSIAFSLTELIVVIGIISVLIAVLMPALAKSRRAALAVQCESNLRQIGVGLTMYADENQNVFPTWSGWQVYPDGSSSEDNPGLGWTEQIAPNFVLPTSKVYRCDEFVPEAQINYFLDVRWLGVHSPHLACLHRPEIQNSSQFILSGDCTSKVFYGPPAGTANNYTTIDCDKTDEGYQALEFKGESGGMNVHPGGNNVLFADQHVEPFGTFDPRAMSYNPHKLQSWGDCTPD